MSPELRARLEEWLVSDDPVERAHATWRLSEDGRRKMEDGTTPQAGFPPSGLSSVLSLHSSDLPTKIPLAESLPLLRLVNSCPYRSRDAACGCSGFRCALRSKDGGRKKEGGGEIPSSVLSLPSSDLVSHLDCLDCVKRYEHA
jgi:hypothetical protein